MSKKKAWVTGAGGLIGSYLIGEAATLARAWEVCGLTRADVDLTDTGAVRSLFAEDKPGLVIHCAGLTKTKVCETNPSLAHELNVKITATLCELATNIRLVFFSTDLVFDGQRGNYMEADPAKPLSVYGQTKVAAEQIVLANPLHTVIRTSLNAGVSPTGDRAFNEEMRRAWQAGQTLRLFTDEFRTPTPAEVTARAVWELVAQNQPGLYHLAGSERLSRWQIGQLLAARWPQVDPKIEPASIKEYRGAPRPRDSSLNCAKIQRLLSFKLPGLAEWLRAHPPSLVGF
jgi:dTDP-4-dehydrorhamnose reductase